MNLQPAENHKTGKFFPSRKQINVSNWLLHFNFLLGSIPFGLLISRYWLKVDIRRQGSGNIGMTNVMRVGGKWPGIVTFVLDFGKGSLAVLTAKILFPFSETEPETQLIFHSLAGITVVCGHVFFRFSPF